MKNNLYYRTVFQRKNVLKEVLLNFFFAICSWPRLLLEVFIRRDMGQRYYSFSSAVTVSIFLALTPVISSIIMKRFIPDFGIAILIKYYFTWYIFLAAYLYAAIQRRNEIRNQPSVFDFARFSKSTGYTYPPFLKFITRGKAIDIRTVETKLEPRLFFLIGLVLSLLSQPLGSVLIQCSVIYALSYRAAYYLADQAVMDKIDEFICNEEMAKSLVEGRDASETRGFRFMGRRPANLEDRQRLANAFMQVEETVEAI